MKATSNLFAERAVATTNEHGETVYTCQLCGQGNFSLRGICAHLGNDGQGTKACRERRQLDLFEGVKS